MHSSYDIITYKPEFKEQVLELQTQLWSPSLALNRAYFDWKHERNPYAGTSMYLALHQSRVVGMRSFFGVRWEAGSPHHIRTDLYADDMVIAHEHRNRGLMLKIMQQACRDLARQGYAYLFNLSAGPVTLLSSLSMGWRSAGSMQPMRWWSRRLACKTGMIRVAQRFPVLSHRGWFRSSKPAGGVRSLLESVASKVPRFGETPSMSFSLEPRADAMAELVKRIGSDGRIRHVRDRTYFEWRFQNPLRRYGFLFCEQRGGLEGYLVLQEDISGLANPTVLNIVDWEATSAAVLKRLLETAHQVAGNRKQLFVWSATLSKEKVVLLVENGFRMVREKHGFHSLQLLVRTLDEDRPVSEWLFAGRRLADLAEWDLRMLYSMHG